MNTRNLPALVDNRVLRLLAFTGLYVAQGLPYGVLIVALFIIVMMCCLSFFNLDKHKARLKIMFAAGGDVSEPDRY